jgi:hypothetical protein
VRRGSPAWGGRCRSSTAAVDFLVSCGVGQLRPMIVQVGRSRVASDRAQAAEHRQQHDEDAWAAVVEVGRGGDVVGGGQ